MRKTIIFLLRCLLSCKDTNLKANHNTEAYPKCTSNVVFYPAKILIWKQITTKAIFNLGCVGCLLSCKDTNLKANHNSTQASTFLWRVVFYPAKILIWKQITTWYHLTRLIMCCLLSCKDTNLKANHNHTLLMSTWTLVVFYPAKILIWKQITSRTACDVRRYKLSFILQRY